MKFLIIRFSSIGDIVLTSPVIRCLKEQVADAEIHYLTKQSFYPILEANPYLTKIHVLGASWVQMIHELKAEKFDVVIDLHHNVRTFRIKKSIAAAQTHSFQKLNIQKWLLTALHISLLPNIHIVDRYLATLQKMGVQNDGKGLDYFIPAHSQVKDSDLPIQHRFGYIGIVIGAALATKQMPLEKWKDLCSQMDYPIILLGGKEDLQNAAMIASLDPIKIYNACGKFSLHESAWLVKNAKGIITHDTGLMHIAAAFKKPILSIWGNTIPAFGMGPYYGDEAIPNQVAEVKGLACRPCSKIGYQQCPKKHFNCMQLQSVTEIVNSAKQLFSI